MIGYIICTIGVVWNTETGMLLAVAWAGVHMTRLCSEGKWSGKNTVRTVTAHALGVIGSLAGAYGLVNLYNILKHSPANTIKEFMLPLMSEAYMTDVLHLDLPLYPSAYMAEVTLFLIGIALGIAEWRWFRKKEQSVSWQIYVVFFLSLSALGRLVYYVNRPAYHNLDCCHFSAVIMLAYLGERGLRFVKERQWKCPQNCSFDSIVRGSLGVVCAAALLAMSTGVVLQFSQNSRIKENFHNRQEFDCFTETIAQQIPANTFAFGLNIAEIYSALHWNSQCFTMDFSDLFVAQKSAADLMEQMQQQEAPQVFTSAQSLPTLEKYNPKGYQWFCENYVLDKTFPIQGEEFQYYVKREGE